MTEGTKYNKLLEDLILAYLDARKNKRNTESQLAFEINLEENIMELYEDIVNMRYTPSQSVCFVVTKPVKREVFASQFRDRVVHHFLFNYISPIFERTFIYDCYSCRKGKGTLFGIERLDHHIRSCSDNYKNHTYILKLDVQGYFMNIDKARLHTKVLDGLNRYWEKKKCEMPKDIILYLLEQIIYKDPTKDCIMKCTPYEWSGIPKSKSLFATDELIGLPIGDLTSQLFSNIYLSTLDDYVKKELKVKHYGRYVDDFFLIHRSKGFLLECRYRIDDFLKDDMGLQLHPLKIYLQSYDKGVHFLGAMIKPHRKYVITRTVKSFHNENRRINKSCTQGEKTRKELDLMLSQVNSYCGHMRNFKSEKIRRQELREGAIFIYFVVSQNYDKLYLRPQFKRKDIDCNNFLCRTLNDTVCN